MKLVDCFVPLLVEVIEAFDCPPERLPLDPDVIVEKIDSGFLACRNTARMHGFPDAGVDLASLAVAAFVDEKILESQWRHKASWTSHLMQQKYMNTTRGGVEFFVALEQLNPYNPVDQQVREVFFYCLSLGFSGQYYQPGDKIKLREMTATTAAMLCREGVPDELMPLTTVGSPRMKPSRRRLYLPEGPLLWGIPLLVIIVVYTMLRQGVFEHLNMIVNKI